MAQSASASPDPLLVACAAGLTVLRAARLVLVHVLALVLILAGYRPAPAAPTALPPAGDGSAAALAHENAERLPLLGPARVARDWAGRPLDCLTVAELRLQARAAGHLALARNGRRADLLAALAAV